MTCRTWWIMASISFLMGMIMSVLGYIFIEAAVGLYLALIACGFAAAGWVLWAIGLISYLKWR